MKKYSAFTMVELIFSIAIMSFFMIALIFSVGKKAQQRAGEATSGRVICYKNAAGKLDKVVELDYGKSIKVDKQENLDVCEYELPQNIQYYTIDVIGAGGGASGAAVAPVANYKEINGSISEPFSCTSNATSSMPTYYTKSSAGAASCKTLLSSYPYFNPVLAQTDASRVPTYVVNPTVTISNQFSSIMDNTTYNANVLKNLTVSVAGGAGKDGETPAMCKITKDFEVGNTVSCYSGYSAIENYRWNNDETWISPTAGRVILNGEVLVNAPGGNFSECGNTSMFSSSPACSGGQASNSLNAGVVSGSYTYNATVIDSMELASGSAGSAGSYVRKEKVKITDDLKIKAQDVGSGGIAGNVGTNGANGGNTCFVLSSSTKFCANGGAGGVKKAVQTVFPTKDIITNNNITGRPHPNRVFKSYEDGLVGSVSDYFTQVFFLMISAEQQKKYNGVAGKCTFSANKLTCEDAKTSEEMSYGLGGSAAQSAVRYDYIKSFKLCNSTTGQCINTPEHDAEFVSGRGANGSGGAIIISW